MQNGLVVVFHINGAEVVATVIKKIKIKKHSVQLGFMYQFEQDLLMVYIVSR